MPLMLHPHLKRGLAFDDYRVHPDDIIEHVSPKNVDPEEQEAKRRRIEQIASQCLQGRPPVMLSAGLRGPFNDGWKNPWAKPKRAKRKSSERSRDSRARIGRKELVGKKEPKQAKRRTKSGSRRTLEAQPVASPETSRAVGPDLEDYNESRTLEQVEVPPVTAPSPNEHDTPVATEFLSVETGECVRSRSPLTNPFWLRRPESRQKFNMQRSANENTQVSPTRSRSALQRSDAKKTLQPAAPKAPLDIRAHPVRAPSPNVIKSSASAPMVISSPVKHTPLGPPGVAHPPVQVKQIPAVAPATGPCPTSDVQPAQVQSAADSQMMTPVVDHDNPPVEPPVSSLVSVSKNSHQKSTLQPQSETRPTREEVQLLAERLVTSQPASPSKNTQPDKRSQMGHRAQEGSWSSQHDLIASPASNSSTGFVYKKVASTKWTIGNAPRSKPRAVNFNSSPATKSVRATSTTSKPSSQNIDTVTEVDAPEASLLEAGISQSGEQIESNLTLEPVEEQQSPRSSRSSRQSAMSTQAAMLLAQLEFQESTFPTSSSRSVRPWSQTQEATPRPMIAELSPAMTPVSVFRPELEAVQPLASVLRGPPMSTQELFAAASPFAFSTVKKRPDVPQHSNLRNAMVPFDGEDVGGSDASPKSPTSPQDRALPKEKNIAPSPWSFDSEKHSQSNVRRSFQDTELPHHTPTAFMNDSGSFGSLHFTERLLHRLDTQRTVKYKQQGG